MLKRPSERALKLSALSMAMSTETFVNSYVETGFGASNNHLVASRCKYANICEQMTR